MGINYRKRVLVNETVLKKCKECNKLFSAEDNFCSNCGNILTSEKIKIYANMGKNGITSYSYKMPDGKTINSKGKLTIPLGSGMSYFTNTK